jgi:hypothetical protein
MFDTASIEAFYRSIFSDPGVDREESTEIADFFQRLSCQSDKLVWLRATAFRIGSEHLSTTDPAWNVNILRTINYLVHAVEQFCLR